MGVTVCTTDDANGCFVLHLSPVPNRWTQDQTSLRSALDNVVEVAAPAAGESEITGSQTTSEPVCPRWQMEHQQV